MQDVSSGRVRASSALSNTEEEAARARQQVEALGRQLQEERQAREQLAAAHDHATVRACMHGVRPALPWPVAPRVCPGLGPPCMPLSSLVLIWHAQGPSEPMV